jgi:hypothetical protein
MKKIRICVAVVILFAMNSCTREFVCQCTYSYEGNVPGLPDDRVEEFIIKDTKAGAENNCTRNSVNTINNGITFDKSCTLY